LSQLWLLRRPQQEIQIVTMKTISSTLLGVSISAFLLCIPVKNNAGNYSTTTATSSVISVSAGKESSLSVKALAVYDSLRLKSFGLTRAAFNYAYKGFSYLQQKGMLARNSILTICDFSQSSRRKRLFVVDLNNYKVLINTYVAHGRRSGSEYAQRFSNSPESHMSSLGFYKTESTYYGGHGLSLKIEGLEKGFNDRADARNIVVHGSEYVGSSFIRNNPFNGRSYGCPAVPATEVNKLINTIKDGSCLFIYHPTRNYLTHSKILNS